MSHSLTHLRRLRRWVAAATAAGISASVVLNVLDAPHNPIARIIAAFPPLLVAGSIELLGRIPSSNAWLSFGRVLGTLTVAGVAVFLSYGHMVGTVSQYGEHGIRAEVFPLGVDGFMLVATLSLIEVTRKIRQLEDDQPEEIPVSPAVGPLWQPPRAEHRTPRSPWTEDGKLVVLGAPQAAAAQE